MESDGNVRTPGSAAYFLVGSSRVPCGPAVSGQLTIPVGRPVSSQEVSGPSLIVQMTPSRSQTQDHHARATVLRTASQPVTMHRFPLQLNHASANHILSPNQHFKQIPVYQRNANSIQMESVRKNVFVSTPVVQPQMPYNRVGLTPHMLMTYMPPRNRLGNNQRTRIVPVSRSAAVLRRDNCPSDDELLEVTEHRPIYDAKKPAELIKVEHNYCFVPRPSPQKPNQINGLVSTLNIDSAPSCIVSPTVIQNQFNITNNNRVVQKPSSIPNNVPKMSTESLQSVIKHEPPIQIESELSASDHDPDGQGEETDTAPEAVAEGGKDKVKETNKSEEPAVTRCICELEHDDGFMISCDKCFVWQHVDCVLESRTNLPEEYLCERCSPRPFNKEAAAALQHMKIAKRLALSSASHLRHSSDSDLSSEPDQNNLQTKRKKYKSRQKNTQKRKSNGLPPMKQRRKSGPPLGSKKKGSMTPEKKAIAEERKKMLIRRKEMLLEKKRIAAMDKKKKVNQDKKIIPKKKTIDYSSDDEPKIFKTDKPSSKQYKSNTEQPVELLRNWIDKYEEAVTNHYSQELRARLSSIKPNGSIAIGELRTPVKIPISRTKISLLPSGIKMLVSSSVLTNNQPIIEVRGKFTWTGSAYKDLIPNRTDPYVFFYTVRFSAECDIEVCVDCRTYGNDARFVRRSCKPNAELKHYIEKGSIHLYIVANQYIEKNSEITINHHQTAVPVKYCNCGDSSTCTASINLLPPATPPLSVVPESSSSSPLIDPTVSHSSEDEENKPQRTKRTRQQRSLKKTNKKMIKRSIPKSNVSPPPPITKTKEPNGPGRPKSPVKKVETSPEPENKSNNNDNKMVRRLSEMSREERKMVAIMKAFERMEKKEARKQEARSHKDDSCNNSPQNINRNRVRKSVVKRKQRPSKNSRSKSTRANRPQRRAAAIANRSYNSSSDEDDNNNDDGDDDEERKGRLNSRKRIQNRCKFSVRFQHRPSTQSSIPRSMLRRSPHNNAPHTPVKMDSEDASGSEGTPTAPLSNTCMLVAAAVGPLAPGFKFPNTKKDFVNSWVKSEGNSPTGSEDYKVGESGCAKKRWLQQAISEQDSIGFSNGDQQVGPLKKRRMARESMSDCPSPTVPGSGHISFAEEDVIEDEEVEQASRNIASIDSKLAIFKNKSMPLLDLQKSNTVALVESFLGEFKPDDEGGSSEPPTPEKQLDIKPTISEDDTFVVESKVVIPKDEPIDDLETSPVRSENILPLHDFKTDQSSPITTKTNNATTTTITDIVVSGNKESFEATHDIKNIVLPSATEIPPLPPPPVVEKTPPPPPPPPPVKRKLSLSEYRRRKESQASTTKEKEIQSGFSDVSRPSPSVSPNTSLAAYEEITQQVIAKSLELESKLAQKSTGPLLFETSISKEEPKQWENLNDRLRRQFGVNITEDLPKRHPRLSPPSDFVPPPVDVARYSYYQRSDNEQLYSCAKEDILLPTAAVHDNGPPKLFSPPSQAYFSTMFFRQPPPPPPPPPPPTV
ncbi:uncharacterized protein LOC126843108 isoform X2 [Adelges cooleyi]|uniref:uncharacterized protein LOC126843108 isoform X2 n=1 Tax=Adelges cooleyi TaxID=133065 RepID=UPI00217FD1FA|nr:uncharacterized protein LOC126843108 isoform X2 [Adelges cooleyi]